MYTTVCKGLEINKGCRGWMKNCSFLVISAKFRQNELFFIQFIISSNFWFFAINGGQCIWFFYVYCRGTSLSTNEQWIFENSKMFTFGVIYLIEANEFFRGLDNYVSLSIWKLRIPIFLWYKPYPRLTRGNFTWDRLKIACI